MRQTRDCFSIPTLLEGAQRPGVRRRVRVKPDAGLSDAQQRRRVMLACRRVLLMVHELHLLGFQLLRICPYIYATGHWRCAITPVSNTLKTHGACMAKWTEDGAAHYTSGTADEYFGWQDGPGKGPKQLAKMFLERFPRLAEEGYGADWEYSGWLVWMLAHTDADDLPYAFAEYTEAGDYLRTTGTGRVPLPPPGEADPVD